EADEHQRGGGTGQDQVAAARRRDQERADVDQIGAAGGSVNPRDSVEQERGGERSEQEIFQSRFVVALVVAKVAGQNVSGDGGNLQSDEDHDQLVGRRHDALTGDGEQQQRVVFGRFSVLTAQVGS